LAVCNGEVIAVRVKKKRKMQDKELQAKLVKSDSVKGPLEIVE
jgi:hypothetical protein